MDQRCDGDVADAAFTNVLFTRLVAKRRRFTRVDFKYTIFDACYLRECVFDTCDFTGCRFLGTNCHGSKFVGCKFDYATFERTNVDLEILESGCPAMENLTLKFARSLRMNYQQLGEATGVNRAIQVELEATGTHLYKAWRSTESYYRNKYRGWRRVEVGLEWLKFKALDWIWGNGESALKLLRSVFALLLLIAAFDVLMFRDPQRLSSYSAAFVESPQILLGAYTPPHYSKGLLTLVTLLRLIGFSFLMSIIIKRLGRR